MKNKKRMGILLLAITIGLSSTPIYATNQSRRNTVNKNSTSQLVEAVQSFTTVDGQEVYVPKKEELERKRSKINKNKEMQENGFAVENYGQTKEIANQKASALTDLYGCTSVQYALMDQGKIVLSGTSGVYSKEGNETATSDHMYGIGSISKMFVTTAIMQLVDEGKVKLDDPVTKYIKEFKMADCRYKQITVRMLLNHSSGLMGSSFSNAILFDDNDSYAHDTFLKQLKKQRLKANPGAYSVYCNDGFTLAEIIVERVTGKSFTKYIEKKITNPLKLSNTKTPMDQFDRNKLGKTYYETITGVLPVENLNVIGAGGIYSTAEDLCQFATIFTEESSGILSKNSLKAMENKEYLNGIWPEDSDNTIGYGLGWDSVSLYPFNQYNIKAVSKGGDTGLYHSYFITLPEENMAIAVVSSGGSSFYNEVMAQEVLLSALKEKGRIQTIVSDKTFSLPEQTLVPSKWKQYEGIYESSVGLIKVDIDLSGVLKITYLQEVPEVTQTLYYTKDGSFASSESQQTFKFVKESNGKIYIENKVYVTLPYLGQTVSDSYFAQKEEVNILPAEIEKEWAKREGKKYYLLNEKYSSFLYMLGAPVLQVGFLEEYNGYFGLNKIVDKNTAIAILDGPGMMSRDQCDYRFFQKGNLECVEFNGKLCVEESAVQYLPLKNKFTCQIGKDGYAKWYKIGEESVGKKITVKIPKKAAFAVYDKNGEYVSNSIISTEKTVTLPEEGTIVFLGNKQTKFKIAYE